HWTRVIPVGTKYRISLGEKSVQLIADWQAGVILPLKPLNPFDVIDSVIGTSKSVVHMLIELTFTEMTNGVRVHAVLSGAIEKGMGDYKSLRTHLSTGSGIPDRAFDQYLTEQTKKSQPAPVVEIQEGPTQNCPYCNSEISSDGIVRPDGYVICPKCFKRFLPE
ncbi:MAG: hypothetical protein KAR03_00265, partial [Candidatus Thorarchaeota archaeon]|nr:hypothetical protein [Candidatus Thorarchaeota archaeon]